eukprot:GDKI01019965.1.p1 GENE.GDKI01019965.1~~GDKI01019965.1.p1  ORF type:complete len:468 (+),score=50.51 GDKI01019965.1:1-1404(+)
MGRGHESVHLLIHAINYVVQMNALWSKGLIHPLTAVSLNSIAHKCAVLGGYRAVNRVYPRYFSSSYSRPRPLGLPFKVSEQEARQACEKKFKGILSPSSFLKSAKFNLTKQYIPFYAYDVTLSATVECAWEVRVNKDRTRTERETVYFNQVHVPFTHPSAQVIATFYHRRAFAERLCGENFAALKPIDDFVTGDEEILPITVDNRYATNVALPSKLKSMVQNDAKDKIGRYTATTTISHFEIHSAERRSVWMPAYVSEFTRLGQPFVDLVCGYTGKVMGPPHFDGIKVGVLSTGVLFFAARFGLIALSLPVNILVSGALGVGAHFVPVMNMWWAERQHSSDAAAHEQFLNTHGKAEGVGPDVYFEEGDREQFEETQFRLERGRRRRDESDLTHSIDQQRAENYKLIGLDPARPHSVSEIKFAFRRTALLAHPDKAKDEKGKVQAEAHLERITHAYNSLLQTHKQHKA